MVLLVGDSDCTGVVLAAKMYRRHRRNAKMIAHCNYCYIENRLSFCSDTSRLMFSTKGKSEGQCRRSEWFRR